MNLRKIIIFTALLSVFTLTSSSIYAVQKVVVPKVKPSAGITVTTALRGKKSILVYFKNLNNASQVSYTLSYKSKNGPQGVIGTISTKGKYSLTRELLFGTCSNKVCRYDTNIKDCTLEVVTKLKNGKNDIKRIKIKV